MKEYLFKEKKDEEKKIENEQNNNNNINNNNNDNINNNNNDNNHNNNLNLSVSDIFCYKIWLHAWTYKFENYEFKTSIPDWATKEYNPNYLF